MTNYKCMDCWRVYDQWQISVSPMESCTCGSRRFREAPNLFIRRLFTDFKHVIKTLFGRETESE